MNFAVDRVERLYTRHEHAADVVVHVLGTLFAINASICLLSHTKPSVLASVSIYCLGLLAMNGISTAYVMVPRYWPYRRILRRLDHAAIFITITATFTPFAANRLGEPLSTIILVAAWLCTTFAVAIKMLGSRRFERISLVLYLGTGWICVAFLAPLSASLAHADYWLLIAGGTVCSTGVIFHISERIPYHCAIWHAFVQAAMVLVFFSIWGEFTHS